MKSFAVLAAVVGLASAHGGAASSGWGKPVYVTDVVTAYTTYCPSATMITHGAKTYTVTEATTLTITDCPCTVTRPVSSFVSTGSVCAPAVPAPTKSAASSGVPPVGPSGAPAPAPVSSTYYAPAPKPSASATGSAPASSYTGAASKVQVAGGMLAALGLVAAAL